MLVTTENLAEMLEVNPNTILNWESSLGLNVKTDESGVDSYSEDLIHLFKEIKGLILNGYSFAEIKKFLSAEIEYQNQITKSVKELIVETNKTNPDSEEKDIVNLVNEYNSSQENASFIENNLNSLKVYNASDLNNITPFKEPLSDNTLNQPDTKVFLKALLKELQSYSEKTVTEKEEEKNYIPNAYKEEVKQEHFEPNSEMRKLKIELAEKEQQIKDYENQKKRLNLLEIQLKIMQLEKNKKKFWEFWK